MAYVAFPGDRLLIGLVERVLIALEVTLVAALAVWLRRLTRCEARAPQLTQRGGIEIGGTGEPIGERTQVSRELGGF